MEGILAFGKRDVKSQRNYRKEEDRQHEEGQSTSKTRKGQANPENLQRKYGWPGQASPYFSTTLGLIFYLGL